MESITFQSKWVEYCVRRGIGKAEELLDGIVCSYQEALKLVLGNGIAAIIIFDEFAVVETEQYSGSAQKFVLCNEEI